MNLRALRIECETRTGYNDTNFQSRWRDLINAAIRKFARKYPWPGLEREISVTLAANQRYAYLPHYVDSVTSLLNTTDNVPILPGGNWDKQNPSVHSQLTTGTPWEYRKAGDVASTGDPSGYLWFKSSHASDAHNIYVTGYAAVSGGSNTALQTVFASEQIQAQGVSPVTLTTLFTSISSIARASTSNGDFFFFDAGASNAHVSAIPASEIEARFRRLEFLFVPSAAKSVRITYIPRLPRLVNDNESPHPSVSSDVVVELALGLFNRWQQQYQKASFHEAEASRAAQEEAHKEENFSEPFNVIQPEIPGVNDPSSDYWRGSY